MSNIVSAVDFDCSYEHFALAGVTKRIKIYDFANILSKPNSIHYKISVSIIHYKRVGFSTGI